MWSEKEKKFCFARLFILQALVFDDDASQDINCLSFRVGGGIKRSVSDDHEPNYREWSI
jgi:hypothetical protein